MSPERWLFVTNQLDVGGAEVQVATAANWLASQGRQVAVLARHGAIADRLDPRVQFIDGPMDRLKKAPFAGLRAARRVLKEFKPQVVVANSLLTATALRTAGARNLIAVAHGYSADAYRIVGPALNLADRVVAVSDDVRDRLRTAGTRASILRMVPNGIDMQPFEPLLPATRSEVRSRLGWPDDAIFATAVGRFVPLKAQGLLIRAAYDIPELHVALVGYGPDEAALRQLAEPLGDRAHFLIERTDIPDILRASDIYVSTSDREGMSMAMIEALAAGLPMLSTRTEGSHTLVTAENGLVVPVQDLPAITGALKTLVGDPELRLAMGVHSRAHALQSFSAERMCTQLTAVAEELL